MATRFDLAIDDENDVIVKSGDLLIAESDQQHIEDTIVAHPGWWKQFPDDGVGIRSWLAAPSNGQDVAKKIRLQLVNDGYTVNNPKVSFVNSQLVIEPNAVI